MECRCILFFLLVTMSLNVDSCLLGFGGRGGGGGRQQLPSSQSFVRFRINRDTTTNITTSRNSLNLSRSQRPTNRRINTLDSPFASDVIRSLIQQSTQYVRSALRKTSNPWPIVVSYEDLSDLETNKKVSLNLESKDNQNENATLHISDQNLSLAIRNQNLTAISFVDNQLIVSLKSNLTVVIATDSIKLVNGEVIEKIRFSDPNGSSSCVGDSIANGLESSILCIDHQKIMLSGSGKISTKLSTWNASRLHVFTNSVIVDIDTDLTLSFSNDSIDLYSGDDSYLSLSADSLDLYFDDVNTTLSLSDDGIDLSLDEQNGLFSFNENNTLAMSFDDESVYITFDENIEFSVRDKNFTIGVLEDRYMLFNQITVPDLKITLTSEAGEFAPESDSTEFKEPRKRFSDQTVSLLMTNFGLALLRISEQVIMMYNPLIFQYGNQQLLLIIE